LAFFAGNFETNRTASRFRCGEIAIEEKLAVNVHIRRARARVALPSRMKGRNRPRPNLDRNKNDRRENQDAN
jgi:hypothetical protein